MQGTANSHQNLHVEMCGHSIIIGRAYMSPPVPLTHTLYSHIPGSHLALRDGYDQLPVALSKGLDVRLNTEATAVHYSTDGRQRTASVAVTDGCTQRQLYTHTQFTHRPRPPPPPPPPPPSHTHTYTTQVWKYMPAPHKQDVQVSSVVMR